MLTIEEFKKNLKESPKPVDVIRVLLGLVSEDNIIKAPENIQRAIYDLAKNEKWKKRFEDFYFSTAGISPYSSELDREIKKIETSCMASTQNPSYATYTLHRDNLLKSMEKFNDEEKESLHEMAKEFEKLLQ